MKAPLNKLKLTNPIHLLALGFGSGLAPKAPGTWGSLVAVLIGAPLLAILGHGSFWGLIVASFLLGCYLCKKTTEDLGVHDHGAIVWDEFVGVFITLSALPDLSWPWLLCAFIVFRFFDVLKPWPIRYFDRKVENGFGIMIDDVVAAIFGVVVILGLRSLLHV